MAPPSRWGHGRFCAWDGEGITDRDGRHRYVILAHSRGGALSDAAGLETERCLSFLVETLATHRRFYHVGYAFSYDVNMMLGDVPRPLIARLWDGATIRWRAFRLTYQPRKLFRVYRRDWDERRARWTWRGGQVWDVFGFFQAPFVRALETFHVGTPAERDAIRAMKALRATFADAQLAAMAEYCREECVLLEQLMTVLHADVCAAGLTLARLDGAGAIAAALFRRHGVRPHRGPLPDEVIRAAAGAYFGGRIEVMAVGHHPGRAWRADLRSAYPHAMHSLPSFSPRAGQWRRNPAGVRDLDDVLGRWPTSVHRVTWRFEPGAVCYPFPWRAADGAVFFPPRGESWLWAPELAACLDGFRAGVWRGHVEVHESWVWDVEDPVRPFAFVPDLYRQRAAWKAAGYGAEKVLKLGLNSLYGKTAQRIGGAPGHPPAWHNVAWAGVVTSTTRAALLRAAFPHLAAGTLVMFATDALYTTTPPAVPASDELGGWDVEVREALTVVQSGVYWWGAGADESCYYRGFDPGSLARDRVLAGWRRRASYVIGQSSRFQGMGRALTSDAQWAQWRQWITVARRLALILPRRNKRTMPTRYPRLDRGLVLTRPTVPDWAQLRGLASTPVTFPWETGEPRPGADPETESED